MTRYFKLPDNVIHWKIVDETTTVIQITDKPNGDKGISRTIDPNRYNSLITHIDTWQVITEEEFEAVRTSVLNYL